MYTYSIESMKNDWNTKFQQLPEWKFFFCCCAEIIPIDIIIVIKILCKWWWQTPLIIWNEQPCVPWSSLETEAILRAPIYTQTHYFLLHKVFPKTFHLQFFYSRFVSAELAAQKNLYTSLISLHVLLVF